MHDNERERQREGLETLPVSRSFVNDKHPPLVAEVETDSISNLSTAPGLPPSGIGAGGPQAAAPQTTLGDSGLRDQSTRHSSLPGARAKAFFSLGTGATPVNSTNESLPLYS